MDNTPTQEFIIDPARFAEAANKLRVGIAAFGEILYEINVAKGFFRPDKPALTGDQFMLMVCELAEGYEAWRKDLKDDKITSRMGEEVEIGDAVIRAINYSRYRHFDLAEAIIEKTQYNAKRPYMHGGKKT
jgi:hypothetical protein